MAEKLNFDTSEANNSEAHVVVDPSSAIPMNVKNGYMFKDSITKELKVGTMAINSSENIKINPQSGESTDFFYLIPEGYHDGTGKVYTGKLSEYTSGNALPENVLKNKVFWVNGERRVGILDIEEVEQTGTATADDIVEGKTAWVNKQKLTGTIQVLPRKDKTLLAGESYTIPKGLTPGTSTISAASLASQTQASAIAKNIESGKTAWVNGEKITGSLVIEDAIKEKLASANANQSSVLSGQKFYSAKYGQVVSGTMPDHSGEATRTIEIGQTFAIPEGYYNGLTTIKTKSLTDATQASAKAANILVNKTAWVNGKKITGTMPIVQSQRIDLDSGTTYNIPEGYHNGSGIIVTKSLSQQTPGTAEAIHIVSGKVAWVNGLKVIGSMTSVEPISTEILPGEIFYIPTGYHTGAGSVWTKSLRDSTVGTATQNDILINKTAWVNGEKVTGLVPVNTSSTATLLAGESYIIPKGYHNGEGKVISKGLPDQTPGTAQADDIVSTKTAWVNGEKITGSLTLSGTAALPDVIAGKTFYNIDTKQKLTGTLALSGTATDEDVLEGSTFYKDDPHRKLIGSLKLVGTATASNVLVGNTFYNINAKQIVSGTMPNIGAVRIEAESGQTYTIPLGYHNGEGYVKVPRIEDQTPGDATPADLIEGKTAWVNGEKIVGNMTLDGNVTPDKVVAGFTYYAISPTQKLVGTMIEIPPQIRELLAGEEFEIPTGYHNGSGKVSAKDLASQTQATAKASDILINKTAWVDGEKITGSIAIQTPKFATLNAGEYFSIPKGYYDQDSIINARDLASQTIGDAEASDILENKVAWINGEEVTGSMPINESEDTELVAGEEFTIHLGYHDGNGKVRAKDLASQTQANAIAENILADKTAWVNGEKITGTMPVIEAESVELAAGENVTIELGFHDGNGIVSAKDLASQTPGDADSGHIVAPYTAWVNGEKITGTVVERATEKVRISAGNEITLAPGFYPNGITIYALYTDRLDLTGTNAWYEAEYEALHPEDAGYVDADNTTLVIVDIPILSSET